MKGEMGIFAGYARTYAVTELLRGLQGGSGARDMAVGVVDHGRAGGIGSSLHCGAFWRAFWRAK